MKKNDLTTNFLGYKIVSSSKDQLLKHLISQEKNGSELQIVFTPNPEQLVIAKSHSSFGKLLGKADYLLPDGVGIVIGSQILSTFGKGEPILHRIAGVDVVKELLGNYSKKKILIVGGRDYDNLQHSSLRVINIAHKQKQPGALYWSEGFLNVSQQTLSEKKELLRQINSLKPEIVFVALGAPYQEKWIIDNKRVLQESGVHIVMAVGGSFDVLLGKVKRAPKWMQMIGLEWLFRLYQEPWRWRRQLNLFTYLKMLVQEALS